METESLIEKKVKITWYRSPIDRSVMSPLMKKSDWRAGVQVLLQLGLYAATATIAYLAFLKITSANWIWSVPLLLLCLLIHGTFTSFMGGVAEHELCHKTPFRTAWLNDFVLHVYSFISWFDPVVYRVSHVKHHQVTVHHDLDGEVILPHKLDWTPVEEGEMALPPLGSRQFTRFMVEQFLPFPNPMLFWNRLKRWVCYAIGNLKGAGLYAGGEWWTEQVLPEDKPEVRRRHRNWARVIVLGHLALATLFIASGHWFLVVIITAGGTYAGWLAALCGLPQHLGMMPDVPDFRRCCRSYTCNRFLGFLYWNMQYHVEHHMFPAVPFYHLPALRNAIEKDLPPATHGLWATWREIIPVLIKQRSDPRYCFSPEIPQSGASVG
jgi:fatty acid desaturase